MRPEPDDLLRSLRVSLSETIVPALEDRWARYVATAMDLVLQHLQLRLAGELDALVEDNADMAATLAGLAADFPSAKAATLAGADVPASNGVPATDVRSATETNERLRAQVVAVLLALDAEPASPEVEAGRTELARLVRRQVDRVNPLVAPLHMSFSPGSGS